MAYTVVMLQKVWNYRNFIITSIISDFKVRFARSKAGLFWLIIHPLAQAIIYTLVLSSVLSSKLPGINNRYAYTIYLLSGLLCWNLFTEIFSRMITIFTDNANIIKKVSFPKLTLPCIAIGIAVVNNIILMLSIFVIFLITGHGFSLYFFNYCPLLIIVISIATGLGLTLGVINIFIRDTAHITNIALQFWFWLTPIVYIDNIIPKDYITIMKLNPMYAVVKNYHNTFLYMKGLEFEPLIYPVLFAILFMTLGYILYKKGSDEMMDEL